MRQKYRWFARVAGTLAAVVVLLFAASEYANRHANFAFGKKAQRYQIEGKPEAFVLEHFGQPAFIARLHDGNAPKHILVYVPGRWSFYPSYCKIGIDERTGTVSGWMINSD